ncbi:phage tail protein [Aeromonas caviae]
MAQYALAVSVISAIASAVSLVISLTAQQDPLQPSDSGVQIDKKGQNDPRLVVFGDAYVPLARVYNNANRYDNKWLVQLFSICVGPIKSVQNVYVNGVPYFGESNTNDMTGWHTQGTSGNFPNVSIGLRKGKVLEDPMYTQIVQNSSGRISSAFRGDRSASLSLLADRWITTNGDNEIRFISPNNKMAAKVQGLSVIDPRLDPNCLGKNDLSKRVWGNSYQNPACCILTYMLDGFFGLNYDVEDIDLSSFILLANYCDQQNLKFNGFLNQSKTRGEILKMFAESFGGAIYREQGLFRVRPLDKSVPVISLDESNIIGNIQIVNGNTDYFNVVKVQFTNTSSNYCEDSYVIPRNLDNDPVIHKDGKQIEKTINLPFLSDGSNFEAVKFFANRAYKKAQLVKKGIVFDVDNTIVKLKYGDVFSVSNELLKFNNKPFRVTAIKNTMDDKQLITTIDAEEYIEEVYNREDYQSGGSSGVLPPPSLQIPVPSNLVFVQNSGVAQGNGTLSWVSNYEGERRTQVQYRKNGSPTWVDYGLFLMDSCSINNLATGVSYDFRIRTHAVIGISRWVEILNKPVNKNINLPAVQNLKGDFSSKDLVITWDPIKGSINNLANPVQGFTDLSQLFGYYQVTIAHDTIGNVKGTFIATSPRFTYTFDRNIQNGKSRNILLV